VAGGEPTGVSPAVSRLLAGLNEPQREAVTHVDGPLLILAGAGSGKTRVLTHRVAYLLAAGHARPDEVVAITFTNKAAGEMKERIEGLVGGVARTMWVSTFHAMCARILRREAQRLGYKSTFSIHDADDQKRLVRRCMETLELDTKRNPPEAIARQISDAKNQLQDAAAFREQSGGRFGRVAADVYELYEKELLAMNAMDFDDLLMRTVQLLEQAPERLRHYQRAFRYVLIDEYQDTNHAQYRLANLLAGEHRNLAVVGDDDQSIYSWRGADIRNILEFERDYPDAKVVRLEQNYRSTQAILDVANAVVTHNRQRKGKNLWTPRGQGAPAQIVEVNDERAEAQFVASEVQKLLEGEAGAGAERAYAPHEIAVLYRTNAQSRVLEEQFGRYAIAYQVIGGPKFYERAEIRDVLAYLTLLVNPGDTQRLLRVVNVPKRGLGATSLGRLQAHAASVGTSVWEAARDPEAVPGLTPAAVTGLLGFAHLVEGLQAGVGKRPVAEVVRSVLEETGYEDELKGQRTLEAEGRLENLEEFLGVSAEYDRRAADPSLDGFLQEISLYADSDSYVDTGELITLMTLHNAKGLEFPVVFIAGMEEGVFPHQRSLDEQNIEEERRLAYVGMTRAMDRLYLLHARARSLWGSGQYNLPSRFLDEIPERLVERQVVGGHAGGWGGNGWGGGAGSWGGSRGAGPGGPGGGREGAGAGHRGGRRGARDWDERPETDEDYAALGSGRIYTGGKSADLDAEIVEQYFAAGERVLHATLGEGTVLVVESGGIVLVRFENDGSERRLMASVAPLRRLRG
jgi:DNA helicase-2/ATP-dependent DNA helicase PcrA